MVRHESQLINANIVNYATYLWYNRARCAFCSDTHANKLRESYQVLYSIKQLDF